VISLSIKFTRCGTGARRGMTMMSKWKTSELTLE
jgi:hypothetical protein